MRTITEVKKIVTKVLKNNHNTYAWFLIIEPSCQRRNSLTGYHLLQKVVSEAADSHFPSGKMLKAIEM